MANRLQILGNIVNVAIDKTLSAEGAAADAKVTGDAINSLGNLVGEIPVQEQIAQAIRDNKTDLSGYATEEYVGNAIAQSASDLTVENEKYVDNKIAGLVNSAPDTLNTLNELAAALDNDPNFSTTVMTQIGEVAQVAQDNLDELTSIVSTNYNESIIGLSIDGTTITCIKGDGSEYTFETQDTNTTYSLGTDTITGLTKLYATTGSAEDGTMTQKAIKTELDKKVGVTINNATNTLIFTI